MAKRRSRLQHCFGPHGLITGGSKAVQVPCIYQLLPAAGQVVQGVSDVFPPQVKPDAALLQKHAVLTGHKARIVLQQLRRQRCKCGPRGQGPVEIPRCEGRLLYRQVVQLWTGFGQCAPCLPGQQKIEARAKARFGDTKMVTGVLLPALGEGVALQENIAALLQAIVARVIDITELCRDRLVTIRPVQRGGRHRAPLGVLAPHPARALSFRSSGSQAGI